jgi:hypothetical protein
MDPSWRGHCPHRDRDDEIGDAKQGPGVGGRASINRLPCQQGGHDNGKAAGRKVANPCGQGELPGQASSGIAEARLATLRDRDKPMAAIISGISNPNNTFGTAVSLPAKYVFAEPTYWAITSQVTRTADSTVAVAYREVVGAAMRAAPIQMRLRAIAVTRGRTVASKVRTYPGIWGDMIASLRFVAHLGLDSSWLPIAA